MIDMSPTMSLDGIIISDELDRRPPARTDHLREKLAVYDLAAKMADDPSELLPRFVDIAMEITGGVAAGLSLLDPYPAPGVFRWKYLRGSLSRFEGITTPRDFSPCGVTLDANRPVLARHAERHYGWISDAGIEVPEVLLVPLRRGEGVLLGTLWIVSEELGQFDRGHAQTMMELASFISIALRVSDSETLLQRALVEQETLAREMAHRLQNLVAVTDSMIRITAAGSATPSEMAKTLSGRLQALSLSNSLIRRHSSAAPSAGGNDLAGVIRTIIAPLDEHRFGLSSRFTISGPPVSCAERSVGGVALIVHELATNAVKYGGLSQPGGRVGIAGDIENGKIRVRWEERGGPAIDGAPGATGFGTTLVENTITGQFDGTLTRDWQPEGLVTSFEIPLERFAD
ncbi:sensor histidine kinase [Roseococcus sp.]|uniref:sensor histidine kinase n=1 Tax=Roseococcus sp. TaxID=2109646 RepID=UPI003BA8FE2A